MKNKKGTRKSKTKIFYKQHQKLDDDICILAASNTQFDLQMVYSYIITVKQVAVALMITQQYNNR